MITTLKILKVETIYDLLTMDIEGVFTKPVVNALAKDNNGNVFKIKSVAMLDGAGVNKNHTTIVIEEIDKKLPWGDFITLID